MDTVDRAFDTGIDLVFRQEADDIIAEMPKTPADLGLLSAGRPWRAQQPFAIAHAVETLVGKRKKFWLLNGATGSGKSIVAAGLARVLGVKTTFLTHTIQLQQQYLDTLPQAATATGKSNHECKRGGLLGQKMTVDDCESCEFATMDGCGYYAQMFKAERATEVVLNYAYASRVFQAEHFRCFHGGGQERVGRCSGCNPFTGRELLVCDEGHLAEDAVVSAVQTDVSRRTFGRAGYSLPSSTLLAHWIEWARATSLLATARYNEARQTYNASRSEETLKQVRLTRHIVDVLGKLAEIDEDSTNQVLVVDEMGGKVRPLWGWDDAYRTLFNHFDWVVLMSATLGDPKVLTRKLGIPADDWGHLDLASPFPAENRKVWRWPVAKLGRSALASDWGRMGQAIDHILTLYPDRKGIIHTASHKLTEMILGKSAHRDRLLGHSSSDRMKVLEQFKESTDPVVLVSASFSTGLDLPGVLGFQIVPKVPYGSLGDPITKMRFEWGDDSDRFGKKNYSAEAMNTIVQAVGRGVRQESDVCPTYILDANFNHLVKSAYSSQSFKDALGWFEK